VTSYSWRQSGADLQRPKRREPGCVTSAGSQVITNQKQDQTHGNRTGSGTASHRLLLHVHSGIHAECTEPHTLPALHSGTAFMGAAERAPEAGEGPLMVAFRLTGNRCRCTACGEPFNSVSTFDRHRIGGWQGRGADRRCLSSSEMRARGWDRNAHGFWIERRTPRERIERLRPRSQPASAPASREVSP